MKIFHSELFRDLRHLVNRAVKVGKIILFQIQFHPFDEKGTTNFGRDVGTMKHFHAFPKWMPTTIFSPER